LNVHICVVIAAKTPDDYIVNVRKAEAQPEIATMAIVTPIIRLQRHRLEVIGSVNHEVVTLSRVYRTYYAGCDPEISYVIYRTTVHNACVIGLAAVSYCRRSRRTLTVHEHVECIVVEFVDVICADLDVLNPDTNRDRGDCSGGVKHFGDPESHVAPARAEWWVMENFNSYRIPRHLAHDESTLKPVGVYWINIIGGPSVKDTANKISCLSIPSQVVSEEVIAQWINCGELDENTGVHSPIVECVDHSATQLELYVEHVLNSHVVDWGVGVEVSKLGRKHLVVERLLLDDARRIVQKL
jgi:hypothetical protein